MQDGELAVPEFVNLCVCTRKARDLAKSIEAIEREHQHKAAARSETEETPESAAKKAN